jgi:hypothetical protein
VMVVLGQRLGQIAENAPLPPGLTAAVLAEAREQLLTWGVLRPLPT